MTVKVTGGKRSSGSDIGSPRMPGDRRHRIILRPEQILFELDADPTWSEYDQADRELAEREERVDRAAGSPDATSGADRGDAVRVLRQRLEVQQVTELAEYGARLADAVRGALAPGARHSTRPRRVSLQQLCCA